MYKKGLLMYKKGLPRLSTGNSQIGNQSKDPCIGTIDDEISSK